MIGLYGGVRDAKQKSLSSLMGGQLSIKTATANPTALVGAFENYYESPEHVLDINCLIRESHIDIIDCVKGFIASLQSSRVGNVISDEESSYFPVTSFTERTALKIRHDFVTTLSDSPVKRILRESLRQSFPLPKRHPRDMFDLLISRSPAAIEAWLRFLELAVTDYCRKWLAAEGILIDKIEPYPPKDQRPAICYPNRTDSDLGARTPIIEENERWSNFEAARSGPPNPTFEVTKIYITKPDVYWPTLNLRPDGIFFTHRSARCDRFSSRSVFHYFRPEAHPRQGDILDAQCESVFVLEAPVEIIERMSPFGVLHYGYNYDEVFPVFESVNSLVTQTRERGLNRLLKEGKIYDKEYKRLTDRLMGIVSFNQLSF